MSNFSTRDEIIEIVNRLFIYTDQQDWEKLSTEVFTELVTFDMSSISGVPAKQLLVSEICTMWKEGFKGIDAIHHQAGNHLVTIKDERADVFCYATATHYMKETNHVKIFVGTYKLDLIRRKSGWRINGFRYNAKYII
jgi:hypothetical protein